MKKMKSIKKKLMLSIASLIILPNLLIFLIYFMAFNSFFDEKSTQNLLDASNSMKKQFEGNLLLASQTALRMTLDKELRNAVMSRNAEQVKQAVLRLADESKVDLCMVTDGSGMVLAHTHGDKIGDIVTGDPTVAASLKNERSATIRTGPAARLSLTGGSPIYSNGKSIVGTVTVGFRLDTDKYVDEEKRIIGQEVMLFLDDECIASTVKDKNGQRVTDIEITPEVAAKVFAGERHTGRMILSGKEYLVCHTPLFRDNQIIGVLSSALSASAQERALKEFLLIGSAVSLSALAIALVLVYHAVNKVVHPIHELAAAFQHVTNHMVDGNVCVVVGDLLPQSDITEIDYLQGALRSMLEQLNRTYDMQVKAMEVEIEKERILANSQAKDRVFANISHEIRTPMNAILGISEILLHEGDLSEQQTQYIRDIKISTENLLVVVNDVLDLSKLEAGKMQLSPVDYDFQLFLSNIDSLAEHLAEDKGLHFLLTIEGQAPKCLFGDNVRLRQILVNLIGNAIKFTHCGDITLTVHVEKDSLRFAVTDTGIGIPAHKKRLLFDAFEQVDVNANSHLGGTGLGLSICRHLAELMDGEIFVESEYGMGSTFTVVIPKVSGDESKIRCWEEDESVAIVHDARILIVDDQKINLNVACGLIRALYGIECDTASSGPECIRKAEQNAYDVIFMDHMMPGMDGVETTRELRKRAKHLKEVPVIALTANAVNGMEEYLLANGMNGFLSKPILKKKLREVMQQWLGRKESESHSADEDQSSIPAALAKIPDLNTVEGLDNAGGQVDIYINSLNILHKITPDFIQTARKLSAEDDLHELAIHIHGMKSSLAGVGATKLSGKFFAWEQAFLANQHDACRKKLPELLHALKALGKMIRVALSDNAIGDAQRSDCDRDQALEAACLALSNYDYDAVMASSECLRQFSNSPDEEMNVSELLSFIEQFDYDGALGWLEKNGFTAREQHRKEHHA